MFRRFVHVACAWLVSTAASPAAACTYVLPEVVLHGSSGPTDVPLEGVIVLSATDLRDEVPQVWVRDSEGIPVPGQLGVLRLRPAPDADLARIGFVHTSLLLVWRADAPFRPGARYRVDVGGSARYQAFETVEVTAAALPVEPLEATAVESFSAERRFVSESNRLRCDATTFGSGGCPECVLEDASEMTDLSARLLDTNRDPYVFYRLTPETGAPIGRDAFAWTGIRDAHLYFPADAPSYCAHVETVSLVDGSRQVGPTLCVEHADVSPMSDEPLFYPPAAGCGVAGRGSAWPLAVLVGLAALALRRRK